MVSPNYSFYFLISYSQEAEGNNSPPTASNSSATTTLGQPIDIKLEVSDAENNELQLTIVDQPQFGTLGEMNPTTNTVTYTPNPDAIAGSDSFTFTVNDGTVDSKPATVSITLEGLPNQPPTAQPVSETLGQGESKDIVLKALDPDTDDELVFFIVNGPQNGQLGEINQENRTVSYTPNEGFTGQDTFTYLVSDLTVDSNE
ncbi:MAG TPA: Ig-like domain-containing protein, partial [Nitrososphaeraceae archaeon]|nr:Ig-like domain-containing protein [Nitrososphaeraceae archaeon]